MNVVALRVDDKKPCTKVSREEQRATLLQMPATAAVATPACLPATIPCRSQRKGLSLEIPKKTQGRRRRSQIGLQCQKTVISKNKQRNRHCFIVKIEEKRYKFSQQRQANSC
jgi:hypothetical protein